MGFRFKRSVKIAPGVRLNVGKKSASVSFGVRGARHTISTTGRRTTSIGIPGTGLYYTESSSSKKNNYSNNINSYDPNSIYEEIEKFNTSIGYLTSLHKYCDFDYNWNEISKEPDPFNPSEKGPNELEAIRNLENYRPNLFEKIFKSKLDKKTKILKDNIKIAKEKDIELYEDWKEQNQLSKLILDGDTAAYYRILQYVDFSKNLEDFLSYYNFDILHKDTVNIEYKINIDDIIPEQYPTATKTGKLSIKNYTKTAYYELVKLYVCSFAIRIARSIFGILPVRTVIIHTNIDSLNTETGHMENYTILSVEFNKDDLENLNFDLIDPFDTLNNFKHNVRFLKTKSFQPVDKIYYKGY